MNWNIREERALSRSHKRVISHEPVNYERRVVLFFLILSLVALAAVGSQIATDRFYSMELGEIAHAETTSELLRDFCEQVEIDWEGEERPESITEVCGS